MGEGLEKKKRATRQRISDVATALFFQRGFDAVTIEEIAQAAEVSKMTVTNYFKRKEDLILDREGELRLDPLRQAVRERPREAIGERGDPSAAGLPARAEEPARSLRRADFAVVARGGGEPGAPRAFARAGRRSGRESRLRAGGPNPDGRSRLWSALVVQVVRSAREEALRVLDRESSPRNANATFFALTDYGLQALEGMTAQP